MAVLANVGSTGVSLVLAGSVRTIVAVDTVAGDRCVVETCGEPACGGVAGIAVVAARDMRRVLAGRDDAIMTAGTGAQHLGMVNCEDR